MKTSRSLFRGWRPLLAKDRRASALVIVLAFIVLVTFLVVAFLTRSQSDLMASANHAKSVQAEQIAEFGADQFIGQLQQEVRQAVGASGTNIGTATIWPARNISDDPANAGDSGHGAGVTETNSRQFLPFRISSTTSANFRDIYGTNSGLPGNPASNIRTDAGRRPFPSARWNAPRLLPYTPVDGSNWVNCPTWIYVTRSGPKATNAPSPYNATLSEMVNSQIGNQNFVIGRYAFIAYDVGGLIDANVCSLTDDDFSAGSTRPPFGDKGTAAFANLSTLFSAAATATVGRVDQPGTPADFNTWRQNTSTDFYHPIVGTATSPGTLETSGLINAQANSNIFLSRQDMIKFSNDNYTTIRGGRPAVNSDDDDSGILKLLRTWSRASDAPGGQVYITGSAANPTPVSLLASPDSPGDWRVSGSDTNIKYYLLTSPTATGTYSIQKGEPFFARRFPLSRIRWFSLKAGANGKPSSDVVQAIHQHFGLTWVDNLAANSNSYRNGDDMPTVEWNGVGGWVYTGPDSDLSSTAPATEIKTLDKIPRDREPDFFEWLKASINPSTLGLDAGMTDSSVAETQDKSVDFHIIQIGANIIDQADPNDIPTLIQTRTARDRHTGPLVAMGVENLPYLNELIISYRRAGKGFTDPNSGRVKAWIQPEIWMPHYNVPQNVNLAGMNLDDPLPLKSNSLRTDGAGNANIKEFRLRAVEGEVWLDAYTRQDAAVKDNSGNKGGTIQAVVTASRNARFITARSFTGLADLDAAQFNIVDDDFSDPKIPGQTVIKNGYNNGKNNQGPLALRAVAAGPEPPSDWDTDAAGYTGVNGFTGIMGGKVSCPQFTPGGGGNSGYANRRYVTDSSATGDMAWSPFAMCLEDPKTKETTPENPNPISMTFPMGEKLYNVFRFDCNPIEVLPNVQGGSGSPLPMTFVMEMQVGGNWIPYQIMENVVTVEGNDMNSYYTSAAASADYDYTTIDSQLEAKNVSNLGKKQTVPGYNFQIATTVDQTPAGATYTTAASASGGGGTPELLPWCRPLLQNEDPDPGNDTYPYKGTASEISGAARNETDKGQNPIQMFAMNDVGSRTIAGSSNNGLPVFGGGLYGWSAIGNHYALVKVDPRTRRFGQGGTGDAASGGSSIAPVSNLVKGDSLQNDSSTWDAVSNMAPGNNWAQGGVDYKNINGGGVLSGRSNATNWATQNTANNHPVMFVGDLTKNVKLGSSSQMNYTDKDGKMRPADYANMPNSQRVTLPLATSATINNIRPVLLNRMYRTPAELGLVFRDVPWRSIDFFSDREINPDNGDTETPSGDLGLLDVFCVEDGGIGAGRIDPNKAPSSVLQALLSNTSEYPRKPDARSSIVSATSGQTIADAIATSTTARFATDSDIVKFLTQNGAAMSSKTKRDKIATEAYARGLIGSLDTRTWNVMVDIVAESGRLPLNATGMGDFMPSGQKRYWVFAAIDRISGRVIDQRIEPVNN